MNAPVLEIRSSNTVAVGFEAATVKAIVLPVP
jgi:hypothetical protein